MSQSPDPRLLRLLGNENLAPLRKRLRRYFERTELSQPPGSFRLAQLSTEEHQALAQLMGRPAHYSQSITVDVGTIDAALRQADIALSLRQALEQLDGPIIHLANFRRVQKANWDRLAQNYYHSDLTLLLQSASGIGLLKRLSRSDHVIASQLCERVQLVLEQLPAQGIPRAQLAAQVLGDAHALDNGQAAATLVLAVLRVVNARYHEDALSDIPEAQKVDDNTLVTVREERSRDIWANVGVLVNELARPALFLNLPRRPNMRPSGEPEYASLRLLLRSCPDWAVEGKVIYVCENPNFLAIAADKLGVRCAPLVCTDGMPAAAQRLLLSQLQKSGAHLFYHGDFDWPGIQIGNLIMREHRAKPWRFNSTDYQAAVLLAPRPGHRLGGTEPSTSWDPELLPAMRLQGLSIAEEMVSASLLQDLYEI
ncbi:TIGR02679 family protein [Pseudomonas fluorescens]|jgi:uncharacterized protein (TIGR02679 family)|uniref:TIGR02679 family protein n=1 Tax=Pseudomonas fluorescens TaxID=294 RepID=UPI003D0294EC